jgi:hypothetical protein
MAYKITNNDVASLVTEVGIATSNEDGLGSVVFTEAHNPNVYIVLSSIEDSTNCYVISKTISGFTFGTSAPVKKISYKVISVSP